MGSEGAGGALDESAQGALEHSTQDWQAHWEEEDAYWEEADWEEEAAPPGEEGRVHHRWPESP